MKKILILTITAGSGHNSAAFAVKQKLNKAGCEIKVVDLIKEYSNSINAWAFDKGYGLFVGYFRWLYNRLYVKCLKWDYNRAPNCPVQNCETDINGKLLNIIYDFQPDVIFCTAYYCAIALENIKRVYPLPSKNIACILDYGVSPFWEAGANGLDYLTLSNEELRTELLNRGFQNEQLIETGIPLREEFYEKNDKLHSRRELGLDENLPTLVILYGGGCWHGGYEVLKAIVNNIKRDVQIIIINGHDAKTKQRIDREMKRYPKNIKLHNIGFTKEIDKYMSACDFMIGKGGGLCTTEVITKGTPLLITEKLPMQEMYNLNFLKNKGLAKSFKNTRELVDYVNDFLDNPEQLKEISDKFEKFSMNGNENICNLIMSQPDADYSNIDTDIDYSKINKTVKKARKEEYKRRKKAVLSE